MLATTYILAPGSLRSWFPYFTELGDDDVTLAIGERPDVDVTGLAAELGPPGAGRQAVFYSAHHTLRRDRCLGDGLVLLGFDVHCQSHHATALGADKLVMKEFLRRNGLPTPAWRGHGGPIGGDGERTAPDGGHVVVKDRHGTQSAGTRLARGNRCELRPGEFCEHYCSGVEYSVNVYRGEGRMVIFPAVWKGRTSLDLIPPWRRLRLCPYPDLPESVRSRLFRMAGRIASAAAARGYLEVEFLVSDNEDITVLEINPRVSGTMRLAAMATGIPIFSVHRDISLSGIAPAVRFAAEAPYQGPPLALPADQVFATSRLTVAAGELPAVLAKLDWFRADLALPGSGRRSVRDVLADDGRSGIGVPQ